jgi:hypothetical protein
VVLALAVGAAVVLLWGDGEDETQARRDAVAAYIVEINQTQQTLIIELTSVSRAYRDLELKERPVPGQLEKVEAAERELRNLRARLATLSTPGEARPLRAEILRLVDLQTELAHEVAGMVRYIPLQAAENRRFAAATKKLRDGLQGAKDGAAQRKVFAAYRAAVLASAGRLERASAPAVLEPSRMEEIARLERLAGLAHQLDRALEAERVEDVNRLFPRLVQTSASAGTTPAERKAVIAFNRRVRGITAQRSVVNAERTKLDLELR